MITNVSNPVYATADNSLINCTITIDSGVQLPFTANPNDVEQHGRDIYADIVAGKYGPIASFVGA